MKTKRTEGESCLNFRRRRRRSSVFGEMRRSSHFSASMPATSCSLMRHHQLTSLPIGYTHKEQLYILSHLVSQVKSGQLASGTERKLLRLFLITFLKKWQKMISCARVYWICHLDSWIFHPGLCFISFQKKFNYPVPSHFQFSGRDGSGTWKKVRDGSGTGIPSDPGLRKYIYCSWVGNFLIS